MKNFVKIFLFLILLASGCSTFNKSGIEWPMPEKPHKYQVIFQERENGLFIDQKSANNLLKNANESETYERSLEILVDEMKSFYNAK